MGKKLTAAILALMLCFASVFISLASGETLLSPSEAVLSGVELNSGMLRGFDRKDYFMFEKVDLTGIKSIHAKCSVFLRNTSLNGETLAIMADDYKNGTPLGYLTFTKDGQNITASTSITPTEGVHDLYFYCLYGKDNRGNVNIFNITLSKEEYKNPKEEKKVPDSAVIDIMSDTWASTDDYGRAVADFEEAGSVKTDGREVGILYWNWNIYEGSTAHAAIISEVEALGPNVKNDFTDPAWDIKGRYYWDEPLLGFYDSYDYWVYKKHAEMLAIAGVDAIFFDYTNGGRNFISCLDVLVDAFRDAKASGIDIPKLSIFSHMGSDTNICIRNLLSIYFYAFVENDLSDIWYYFDGKPLIYGNATPKRSKGDVEADNLYEKALLDQLQNFFTVRENGTRNKGREDSEWVEGDWMWLENFPQVLRSKDPETGRPEFVCVGSGINQSTVYGGGITGVFSDPYSKGRGFSEVFGEDYSENGKREGYFFAEQAALALDAAPEFIMIDGWNEFNTVHYDKYGFFEGNVFVDTYDSENSRDFEPVKGVLKDDYYNLMTDFIRKYKGVRPVPTASGMKTVNIEGDLSQWDGVGPEFKNAYQDYERDDYGIGSYKSDEVTHFTTKVNNAIKSAKVSFDDENLYFLVRTQKDIKDHSEGFMTLYINADRNYATGWEGYDYAVNLDGKGTVSAFGNGTWERQSVGNVQYKISGDSMQTVIPRSLIGETGAVDLEFKWTDSIVHDGDILTFYQSGSSAPLGRFNYVFTEITQTSLSEEERTALKGTALLKAGSTKMIVNGAKMNVYEKDITVAPFEANGTLYVPREAFREIMGYGRAKVTYNSTYNMYITRSYNMNDELTEVCDNIWTNCILDSLEVWVNGRIKTLSAPVIYKDDNFWIPLSFISDCYGRKVSSLGDGKYTVSKTEEGNEAASEAVGCLN